MLVLEQTDCSSVQVIILIGNKADLEAQRDVTYEEAKQFAEENGEEMSAFNTSCLTWTRQAPCSQSCTARLQAPSSSHWLQTLLIGLFVHMT